MFKAHVRKGDTVKVIAGEDAGKTGNVLSVDRASQRVVVEGINIQKRHTRPSQANPEGGIVRRPGPVHISNVMLVCPNLQPGGACRSVTRDRWQRRRVYANVAAKISTNGGKGATVGSPQREVGKRSEARSDGAVPDIGT